MGPPNGADYLASLYLIIQKVISWIKTVLVSCFYVRLVRIY